ncbi:MAG: MotA/TolQ/ExbB proton channel family protein [Deltaproteobacteria bacterium]|nr:MotA/TolQ/ExbB proton channel family protein [Deltaproteobacteria bacterium]
MQTESIQITESLAQAITVFGAEWVMWLLIALSVLSISVMVERWFFYRRRRIDAGRLAFDLAEGLDQRRPELARAAARKADRGQSLEVAVALEMIGALPRGADHAEQKLRLAVAREKVRYERGLSFLGTLGNNAPFIGLFGTVLGIIKAFADLAANTESGNQAVMAGISEALVATAIGLLVALPAVMMFNIFKGKVQEALRGAELIARTLMDYAGPGEAAQVATVSTRKEAA